MTFTATYNDDLARIQLQATGAPAAADFVRFERSTDLITWTEVRGGQTVGLTSGAGSLDDYEFVPGALNYYRASYVDTATIAATLTGAYTVANNASVVPPLPAGIADKNMMILTATHQNTAATVNTPTGWTLLSGGASHFATFYREYQAGVTAPTVTFSGGSAGQFLVGPVIASGVPWDSFWIAMGLGGLVIAVLLYLLLPAPQPKPRDDAWAVGHNRAFHWDGDAWTQITPESGARDWVLIADGENNRVVEMNASGGVVRTLPNPTGNTGSGAGQTCPGASVATVSRK